MKTFFQDHCKSGLASDWWMCTSEFSKLSIVQPIKTSERGQTFVANQNWKLCHLLALLLGINRETWMCHWPDENQCWCMKKNQWTVPIYFFEVNSAKLGKGLCAPMIILFLASTNKSAEHLSIIGSDRN